MYDASLAMHPSWCTMQEDLSHDRSRSLEQALYEAARFSRDFPGPNTPVVIDGIGVLYASVTLHPAFFARHGLKAEAIESYMRNLPPAPIPDSAMRQCTTPVSAARRLALERYGLPSASLSSEQLDPLLAALLYHLIVPSVNSQGRPLPRARSLDTMLLALHAPVGQLSDDLQSALPSENFAQAPVDSPATGVFSDLVVAPASSNGTPLWKRIMTACARYFQSSSETV